ncbi:helix-turn-helix domain-containing protein [Mahella australiensis]|uniref:Helix-turn-helix domain protein n=1 Tax=Mahella australiensis (strain DSM 15567 / CIP 107919 / 50-1 BON) TaxID=697281 RepID=F3ZZD7_MAHA5|nr:helix-turn-helix domain-containing protein [Mahella australiensis]AEE95747.1 helix-turn-helix domain protein [Mahella australiensis 50-1 BON]
MSFNYIDHYTMKQNRLKVLEKNNYRCAICGMEATEVHHQDHSYSNHNIDNLLPVCHKCHMQLHVQSRSNNEPKINSDAIEYLLMVRGMNKQELAQKIHMSNSAITTILKRKTTKNSTLKKIAEVLDCSIKEIVTDPSQLIDWEEKENNEEKILVESINERINQLTNDKRLTKLYKIWLEKELREFFNVKSYGLISGKNIVIAIKIINKWEPGADISKLANQANETA